MRIVRFGALLASWATMLLAGGLAAQGGMITGRVVGAETGAPVIGARVEAIGSGGQSAGGDLTNNQGQYRLSGLAPGTYSLTASVIGYATGRLTDIRVEAGQTTTAPALLLQPEAVQLNPVVISASRRQEKALEAPARVEVIPAQQIEERPVVNITDHLRSTPGLSFVSQGLGATNIAARGFNNIFSGALHVITDNRIAAVPSLRVNSYSLVPAESEDIARMEVVLGPGSALYGPNTANGVVHVITRSPLDDPGTTVTIGAGERSLLTGSLRTAHRVSDNFGIKVSGRYLQGEEWAHEDRAEVQARQQALAADPNTRIGLRDYDTQQYAFDARADWRLTPGATAIFSTGRATANGIELTGIGAAQVRDWTYAYYQARFNWNNLFAQAYLNTSDAGETFTLRDAQPIVDRSQMFVAQLQHGFDLGARQSFTYGADFFRTRPDTDGTIHGVNENDDNLTEIGAYLQSKTSLLQSLDLVLAGRIDDHSELEDPVFSPRAAIVFRPVENHNFRVTYNRAFSTPGALNYFLDINSGLIPGQLGQLGYGVRLQGNRGGWSFRDASGTYTMRSPFTPAALGGPGTAMPVRSATMYQLAVGVLQAQRAIDQQTAQMLLRLNPANVGILALNLSNPNLLLPLSDATVPDLAPLKESTNQTFEVGYKGIFGERLLLAADVWYSQIDDFISGVEISSSLLLLNGQDLAALFIGAGIPQAQAVALAQGMGRIPLGTISPANMSVRSGQTDVLLTYRNFGNVDLWGSDISATALLTDRLSLGLIGSFTSDDRFNTDGRTIWLNAPTRRLTTTLGYRDEDVGFNGEVRFRYTSSFAASSGVYIATRCEEPGNVLAEDCIDAYSLLDVNLGYRIPRLRGTSVQLSVTNLLDQDYRSFAGVPTVGRLALLRLRKEF